jgi:hypothetical protein
MIGFDLKITMLATVCEVHVVRFPRRGPPNTFHRLAALRTGLLFRAGEHDTIERTRNKIKKGFEQDVSPSVS